jgi:hypothetical protein
VENPGEVSNFLTDDYDAVLNFMNAEIQKKETQVVISKQAS